MVLYSHWTGYKLHKDLQTALIRGEDRWDDFQYLTRIIFCELVKDDILGTTAFGITSEVWDGLNDIVVNVDKQIVTVGDQEWSFQEYVEDVV